VLLTGGRVQMTDNVGIAIISWEDETGICCTIGPSNDWRRWFLVWSGGWIETGVTKMDVSLSLNQSCVSGLRGVTDYSPPITIPCTKPWADTRERLPKIETAATRLTVLVEDIL
jgi:hypothetical protein